MDNEEAPTTALSSRPSSFSRLEFPQRLFQHRLDRFQVSLPCLIEELRRDRFLPEADAVLGIRDLGLHPLAEPADELERLAERRPEIFLEHAPERARHRGA